jgi:hypothetical protein
MRRNEARLVRTQSEVDELVALARQYCEARAAHEAAKLEHRLSPQQEEQSSAVLRNLDGRLELLKSNNVLKRHLGSRRHAVIQLVNVLKLAR